MGYVHLMSRQLTLLANQVDMRNPLQRLCEQAHNLHGSQFPSLAYEDNLGPLRVRRSPKRDSTPVIRAHRAWVSPLAGHRQIEPNATKAYR